MFYAPLKEVDAPNLCGIIFPRQDYEEVSKHMVMWSINDVKEAEAYAGVDCESETPFAVLRHGLANLGKSPQKILCEDGRFILTREPMLSNPMGMTHLLTTMTNITDILGEFKLNIGELVKILEQHESTQ